MADAGPTEPTGDPVRLDPMRPTTLPPDEHDRHDRWLIVRAATDPADLAPDEAVQARRLLHDCAECAVLAADLGVISHAIATSPTPPRPRDFRITPEQAAASRGSVLQRLGRWIAAPRQAVLRPLAGAALAAGIVLVVVSPMLPRQQQDVAGGAGPTTDQVSPRATDPGVDATMTMQAPEPPDAPVAGQEADSGPASTDGAGPQAYDSTGREMGGQAPKGSGDPTLQVRVMAVSPSPTDPATAMLPLPTDASDTRPPAAIQEDAVPPEDGASSVSAAASAMDDTSYALLLLGIVLAGSGGVLLLLVWFGRRTEDPLLR